LKETTVVQVERDQRSVQQTHAMGEVAKRLSFDDVSLHTTGVLNKANVLRAMGHPSEENFRR
jgi:DUF971 family protein